jgi:hypothetical protein
MSNTSPPSAKANKFVIGILFSIEQALKSHHCRIELGGGDANQFHYSQLCRPLWERFADIEQTRIQMDTLRARFKAMRAK